MQLSCQANARIPRQAVASCLLLACLLLGISESAAPQYASNTDTRRARNPGPHIRPSGRSQAHLVNHGAVRSQYRNQPLSGRSHQSATWEPIGSINRGASNPGADSDYAVIWPPDAADPPQHEEFEPPQDYSGPPEPPAQYSPDPGPPNDSESPADITQPPANITQPPVNATQPPANVTQPPTDGSELPVLESPDPNAGAAPDQPDEIAPPCINSTVNGSDGVPGLNVTCPGNTTDGNGTLPDSPAPELPPPRDDRCDATVYNRSDSQGVVIPPLGSDEKPNFIVILTDDQGWDDIGLHNPDWVNTPNLDKFIRSGTLFDNFYTSPQCAPSRAMVLTGRDYPRTGTLLVNAGWDAINTNETTVGEFMSAAGYSTAQFGKWHNGEEMGYEPWNTGFAETWMAPMSLAAHVNPILSHNGEYVQTEGFLEEVMADKLITYLDAQSKTDQPFFVYYATRSIHVGKLEYPVQGINQIGVPGEPDEGEGFPDEPELRPGKVGRPVPPPYRVKYYNDPKYAGISNSTIDAWAMLEYLDNALGKIFDYVENSPLQSNTYIMIGGDNGPALLDWLERRNKKTRMPSKMMGHKSFYLEGGVRNFWAVKGPGVEAGAIDSTLLQLTDIVPTVADLAGIDAGSIEHRPWDGISFANLLAPAVNSSTSWSQADVISDGGDGAVPAENNTDSGQTGQAGPYRGTSLATEQQRDRYVFTMLAPQCWDFDAIPELDAEREVSKAQPLLDFDYGGRPQRIYQNQLRQWLDGPNLESPGFKACVAVRWREYKWIGLTNKVYRLANGSHVELPCNEVPEPEASDIAARLSAVAREWWQSVVQEPNSFVKATTYLGVAGQQVTNMLTTGAKERTAGGIVVVQNGVTGFSSAGDRICMKVKVLKAGAYEIVLFYTSNLDALMRLSIGSYADITNGSATSVTFLLPPQRVLRGMSIGQINLNKSASDKEEACLELLQSPPAPSSIFNLLSNIQFIRVLQQQQQQQATSRRSMPRASSVVMASPSNQVLRPLQNVRADRPSVGRQGTRFSADRLERARLPSGSDLIDTDEVHGSTPLTQAVRLATPAPGLDGAPGVADWLSLRNKYGWPDGQQVMQSMYAPRSTEHLDGCDVCQQPI